MSLEQSIYNLVPDADNLLSLPVSDLAYLLLEKLKQIEGSGGHIYRSNISISDGYPQPRHREIEKAGMESFSWLESMGLIAPVPRTQQNQYFISRKGHAIRSKKEFYRFQHAKLLPVEILRKDLAGKVMSNFLRGDYDTAVFAAYKELEVCVRTLGKYKKDDYGVTLMRKAFNPTTGKLRDKRAIMSEREALAALFAGAFGYFRNPVSHRDVNIEDPKEAAEMIILANHLINIVVSRKFKIKAKSS